MQRFESKNLFSCSAIEFLRIAFRARNLTGTFEKRDPVPILTAKTLPTPSDGDSIPIAGSNISCYRCAKACTITTLVTKAGLVSAGLEVRLRVHRIVTNSEVFVSFDLIAS